MMKILFSILILLICSKPCFANTIDSLKNFDDVNRFLTTVKGLHGEMVDHISPFYTNKFEKTENKFLKFDIDGNGLADLIIYGKQVIVIRDLGNNINAVHWIYEEDEIAPFVYKTANVLNIKNIPILVIETGVNPIDLSKRQTSDQIKAYFNSEIGNKVDSLIFKFDGLVELNQNPDTFNIQQISFSESFCRGTCPVFDMKINSDRKTIYNAQYYNDRTGLFKTKLAINNYETLVQIINYININKLQYSYTRNVSDMATINLEIKFNNGKVKTIRDYGQSGSFGLRNLYQHIFDLRLNQKWKKN